MVSHTFQIVLLELGIDGSYKFEELHGSALAPARTHMAKSTHHLPRILADALHVLLVQEFEPPLRIFVLPPLLVTHVDVVIVVTPADVRYRTALQAVGDKQLPECLRHVGRYRRAPRQPRQEWVPDGSPQTYQDSVRPQRARTQTCTRTPC